MKSPRFRPPGPEAARLEVHVPDQPDQGTREIDYIRWLSQMQADLAETLGGVLIRAARPVPVGTSTAGTAIPSASAGRLVGWSLHETTGGGSFLVRFRDGTDSSGALIACASGSAGGVSNSWWAPGGLSFVNGLFVEIVSGGGLSVAVEGTAYLGAAE